MNDIDEWIALGDPAQSQVAIAAYDEDVEHYEGYQDIGWQAAVRFSVGAAANRHYLMGHFTFWFFDELGQFLTELERFQQTLKGTASLRTVGGEFELTLIPANGRGWIAASVILRKTVGDSFEVRLSDAFDQTHLTRILSDLRRQFPKAAQ